LTHEEGPSLKSGPEISCSVMDYKWRDLRHSLLCFEDSISHGRLDREDEGFKIFRNFGKWMFRLFISLWQVTPCILQQFSVKESSYNKGKPEKL